jgi:hypothetical protein
VKKPIKGAVQSNHSQGEFLNYTKPDYSKKDITPYTRKDYDLFEYIPFGSDNLFPQAMALFARLSPNHRGVLTSKERYFQGDGVIGLDGYSKEWVNSVNAEGECLNDITKKLWIDNFRTGNEYIELISDSKGSFLFFSHQDSTKCRVSKEEKTVIIHPDWGCYLGKNDVLRKEIALYPNWSEDPLIPGIFRSIYHKFSYEPEFTYYGIPGNISGKDSIQIDFKTNKWNLARLCNSFRPDNLIFVPVKDNIEGSKVMKEIDKHIGEGNQGSPFVVTKSRTIEGQKAEDVQVVELKTEDTGSWIDLHKQSLSDIVMSHGWYRSLCSIPDQTGFDTARIINEFNIALPQIKEAQRQTCALFTRLYKDVVGKVLSIEFKNSPPLKSDKYYYVWEMREKEGLPVDKTDPQQMQIILDIKVNKNTTQQSDPSVGQ